MAMTHAEIQSLMLVILQDSTIVGESSSNDIFETAELDLVMAEVLKFISHYSPRQVKSTKTTTESSRELTLSAEDKRNLLWIDALEYKVDQYPKQFRKFDRWGDTISMMYDGLPAAGESVYLYLAKVHILQKEIGTTDTAGAIKTAGTAGDSTLALKSLGTGTINENTKLTIAGDDTEYTVTATVTIATNEATVAITPVLAADCAEDAVVTLALADSTLDTDCEQLLADYGAAMAAVSKAARYIPKSNIVGTAAKDDFIRWGELKKSQALRKLEAIALSKSRTAKNYSRS